MYLFVSVQYLYIVLYVYLFVTETAAYRSLLTGTLQQKQPMVHVDDGDSDNTDDDVEKQFASTLSPRDPPR